MILSFIKSLTGLADGKITDKSFVYRCSSSVRTFEPKIQKTWGIKPRDKRRDINNPCVFFGMYHLGDWKAFIRHRGKRYVFWAGSDISLLKRNWAFSDGNGIAMSKKWSWVKWYKIFQWFKAEHFVENELEQKELLEMGIKSEVKPSFLEDIDDFEVNFKPVQWGEKPKVYVSTNKNRENEYGFNLVHKIAKILSDIEFHLFGVDGINTQNVIYHGRVSPEQFNEEIKNYHCGLRPNEHDGFSEILAKSVLMGQYPISRIKYPMIDNYETEEQLIRFLKKLKDKRKPNLTAREYWRGNLNQYTWVIKK